jgi:hypothetical protein
MPLKGSSAVVDGHLVSLDEICMLRGELAAWYTDNITGSSGLVVPATEEALIVAVRAMRKRFGKEVTK